ncbi:MAG: hypothetical protein H6745_26895 [Deltaproteobacteria bacterium]|nr:hypothetical protein [Deltaproteobacteria bacterium]
MTSPPSGPRDRVELAIAEAIAANEAGRYREAVDKLSAASASVGAGPLRRELRVALARELGVAHLGIEHLREARHALLLALEQADGDPALAELVRASLADCELMTGDGRAARRWLTDRGRDRRATLLSQARLELFEGELDVTEQLLQACDQAPGGTSHFAPPSTALRSLAAIWAGRPDQARMLYDGVASHGNPHWELVRLAMLRAVWVQKRDARYLQLALGVAEQLRFGERQGPRHPGLAAAAAAHHALILALTGELELALDAADTAYAHIGDLTLPEWPRQAVLHDLAVVYRDAGRDERWKTVVSAFNELAEGPWLERMRRVTGARAAHAVDPTALGGGRGPLSATDGALVEAALRLVEDRRDPATTLLGTLCEGLGAHGGIWRADDGRPVARVGTALSATPASAEVGVRLALEGGGHIELVGVEAASVARLDMRALSRLADGARRLAREREGQRALQEALELAEAGRLRAEESLERSRRPGSATALGGRFSGVVGRSDRLRDVLDRLAALAGTALPVLLEGAPGCGRRHLARAFAGLDEGGDGAATPLVDAELLPEDGQVAVLERLAGRARGAAYIVANAEHLGAEACAWLLDQAASGASRPIATLDRAAEGDAADALRRALAASRVLVPGLDERLEDLPLLLDAFAREVGRRPEEIATATRAMLARRLFPGHVGELRSAVHQAAVRAERGTLGPEHFEVAAPEELATSLTESLGLGYHDAVKSFRRDLLRHALEQTDNNRTRAAELLGLQRTYFMRLIRDIDAPEA